MPTKTARILSYLPGTFLPSAGRSAVRAFVDAPGAELQQAEGQLAAVLQSHWVDLADRGALLVDDLARIGAMYGLAPRHDESVEEFRRHLKRYVRTYLDGTVTVQGILRVTAEALGLEIADAYDQLDSWWARAAPQSGEHRERTDLLATVEADQADASSLVLGVDAADRRGTAARRAEIVGTPDLGAGVDLCDVMNLYVAVDNGVPVEVNLAEGALDNAAVGFDHIVGRLRALLGDDVVQPVGSRITLVSPTVGSESQLVVRGGADDAATAVLGLLPLHHSGRDATGARVVGTADLGAGVDLTGARYLRLLVDGTALAEVDCAGDDPAATFPDAIRDAINGALGMQVASHDGSHLVLGSRLTGQGSTIAIQRAGGQDAAERLLGPVRSLYAGRDPQPAEVLGTVDLRDGADLRRGSLLRLRIDDLPTATVDCAGAIPSHTTLAEVVASINAGVGAPVASAAAGRLVLRSPSTGRHAEIAIDPLVDDASTALLGIPPRLAAGAAATVAHLVGTTDLGAGANLSACHLLQVAVDGGPPVRVELRPDGWRGGSARLGTLADAINTAVGAEVATDDGRHLILRSVRAGGGSRIQVVPLTTERHRPFVTRAFVTGEASQAVLGVDVAMARGDGASRASVGGSPDLSRSVDLSGAAYLRLAVDGAPPVDIRCAGPRPRATLISEVVDAINDRLPVPENEVPVASHDGRRITLTSPTSGAASRIAFEVPEAEDAREALLGTGGETAFGRAAEGVAFVGVADLSAGVDLPPHAMVRIGIDGGPPVDVALTGEEGAHRSIGALAGSVNLALGASVARSDGTHLALVSLTKGASSRVVIEAPQVASAVDATTTLFGIAAPRAYHGADAIRARVTGTIPLPDTIPMGARRYLVIAVDGGPEVVVDVSGGAASVDRDGVDGAINRAMGAAVASIEGGRLVLRSRRADVSARVTVAAYRGGDARTALFGPSVSPATTGQPALPAVLTGSVDLLQPADLSRRSGLRIAVDGAAPVNVDVAGESPSQTSLEEIVRAIDRALPGVARATPDARLRLVSPTDGPESRLEVMALRSLEVVEYPPAPAGTGTHRLRHAEVLTLAHAGVGSAHVGLTVRAPHGTAGLALADLARGRLVQFLRPVRPTDTVRIWRTMVGGIGAEVTDESGFVEVVPGDQLRGGPAGAWAQVPFAGSRLVPPGGLQLDNPTVPGVDLVVARRQEVTVTVVEATIPGTPIDPGLPDGSGVEVTGRLRRFDGGWRLVSATDIALTNVEAGPGVVFADHTGAVVRVSGARYLGEPPYVLVGALSRRYDVVVKGRQAGGAGPAGPIVTEHYERVTIGEDPGGAGLASRVLAGTPSSELVAVRPFLAGDALTIEPGRSRWLLLECAGSRFGGTSADGATSFESGARFDHDRFAGGPCAWPGVFDASSFSEAGDPVTSVFAGTDPEFLPVEVTAEWDQAQPGAFEVNLPADLDARFGGRFDHAVFSSAPERPEQYDGLVTEPPDDDHHFRVQFEGRSIVRAEVVTQLPIGWTAVTLPFRKPHYLRGGRGTESAKLYIQEAGAASFILIESELENVALGNLIKVTARPAGPARFDVTVAIDGARFESAREVVAGPPPAPLDRATVTAIPGGVVQAKAAGVGARVTRERTYDTNGARHD